MLVAVPLIAGSVLAETVQEIEAKAMSVTTQWLQLCDMGRYNETWDTAASHFQNAIKKNPTIKASDFRSVFQFIKSINSTLIAFLAK